MYLSVLLTLESLMYLECLCDCCKCRPRVPSSNKAMKILLMNVSAHVLVMQVFECWPWNQGITQLQKASRWWITAWSSGGGDWQPRQQQQQHSPWGKMDRDLPQECWADASNRPSCQRRHLLHYLIMRRYVPRRSCLPCFNNILQPPSPLEESHENLLKSGNSTLDSSEVKLHVPLDLPMISSVERSDSKPNPDNTKPSKGNQHWTIAGWFRSMMKSSSLSQMVDQTPSEESPETSTPPSNKKPLMIAHAKQEKIRSACFS